MGMALGMAMAMGVAMGMGTGQMAMGTGQPCGGPQAPVPAQPLHLPDASGLTQRRGGTRARWSSYLCYSEHFLGFIVFPSLSHLPCRKPPVPVEPAAPCPEGQCSQPRGQAGLAPAPPVPSPGPCSSGTPGAARAQHQPWHQPQPCLGHAELIRGFVVLHPLPALLAGAVEGELRGCPWLDSLHGTFVVTSLHGTPAAAPAPGPGHFPQPSPLPSARWLWPRGLGTPGSCCRRVPAQPQLPAAVVGWLQPHFGHWRSHQLGWLCPAAGRGC